MIKIFQNSIGLVTRLLSNFFVLVIVGKQYGGETLGDYTLAMSWSLIWILLVEYGFHLKLPVDLEKQHSIEDRNKILQQSLYCKNFFSILVIIALTLFISFGYYPGNICILIICFIFCLVNSYINFLLIYIRICKSYLRESYYIAFSSLLFVVVIFFFSFIFDNVIVPLAFIVLFRSGILLYISKVEFKSYFICFKTERSLIQFKDGVSFFILTMVGVLYVNADTVIMGYVLSKESLALYQVVIQVLLASSIVAVAVSQVSLQKFSSSVSNVSLKSIHQYIFIMFLFGLVVSIVACLLFEPFVSLLFPYLHIFFDMSILKYLFFLIILRYLISPLGSLLTATGNNNYRLYSTLIATLVSILYLIYYHENLTILKGLQANALSHLTMLLTMYCFCSIYLSKKNKVVK